jgi:hypothetical protein
MSYRRSAITPSNFKIGSTVLTNNVIDYQPYFHPINDLYINNINMTEKDNERNSSKNKNDKKKKIRES